MDKYPARIYLQWGDGSYPIAWCVERINDTDIEYVRAEKAEAENADLRKQLEEASAAVMKAHLSVALIPASLRERIAKLEAQVATSKSVGAGAGYHVVGRKDTETS